MKKTTTDRTKSEWWNKEWCPLFGALPSCETWDGVSEKCISIIADARLMWGGFEYLPGVESPVPERIGQNTNYPQFFIEAARMLVHIFSAHDILNDSQHNQGFYKDGTGWKEGREDAFLRFDVDQLEPWVLISNITNRAGLPHKFKTSFIRDINDYSRCLNDDEERGPFITPGMAFSLMSISAAWELLKAISDSELDPKSADALTQLLTSEKLLKAAYVWNSKFSDFDKTIMQLDKDNLQETLTKIKEKQKKDKEGSGDGQKNAKMKRVEKLQEKLRHYINGNELKIDKNEYYKLLSAQFEGAEHTSRDYKTRKAYQTEIEEKNKVKIIWEKGTIIKDKAP